MTVARSTRQRKRVAAAAIAAAGPRVADADARALGDRALPLSLRWASRWQRPGILIGSQVGDPDWLPGEVEGCRPIDRSLQRSIDQSVAANADVHAHQPTQSIG